MSKYQVKGRFSTVVVRDGQNVQVAYPDVCEVDIEDDLAELIEADLPGYIIKVDPKRRATVKTAPGKTVTARTRQVSKAKTPPKKKGGKK